MQFTGERAVEGITPERIWSDHFARYSFSSKYVKGNVVLDIACGSGYGANLLSADGAEKVIGVDVSSEAIEYAISRYNSDGLSFRVGDILDLTFLPDNHFDVVTCFETIEHVKDPQRALVELARVLKPKGLLIISSPNRKLTSPGRTAIDEPLNIHHTFEYLTKEFISLLDGYFGKCEIYGQRAQWRVFFLPIVERALRRITPALYSAEFGRSDLEEISFLKEYRYVTAVCENKARSQ